MREVGKPCRLGEGGLLRRLEMATHLTSLRRQIVLVVSITWLPLVLLDLLGTRLPAGWIILDASVHVRLLVATPIFLFLDHVFPAACRSVLEHLGARPFVPDAALPRFDLLQARATRLADSSRPELVLAAISVAIGIGALLGVVPVMGLPARAGISPARIWYALTDLPLFQFLLWRTLWRWVIWVWVLFGLSRIDLDLVASHPDRRGGISFIRLPSIGYCTVLLFAISSVLCAEWGGKFTFGATVASFTPLLILFAIVGTLIAFGPLLLFTPMLFKARKRGIAEFDDLAEDYGRHFRQRWIEARDRKDPLALADPRPLHDMVVIYRETVDRISYLLFDLRDMIGLLVATIVPVLPVMLVHIPREDWRELLGLMTGGRLR